MKSEKRWLGHAAALLVVMIWASTFVFSKLLLRSMTPMEIMLFRQVIAYAAMWAVYPRRPVWEGFRREALLLLAGVFGGSLYFTMQNVALTYTTASNMSIIVSIMPMMTAIFSQLLLKEKHFTGRFFTGFLVSGAGVVLITLNGNVVLKLNPLGDILSLAATGSWAVYCVIMKLIMTNGENAARITRKVFFYSLLTMIPLCATTGVFKGMEAARLFTATNVVNLLFLGLVASAFGFVVWNWSVGKLGAVKTNGYLYAQPVGAVVVSALVLGERITWLSATGMALALAGLLLSEQRRSKGLVRSELPEA